jgi:tetratricopeptide (TPR) repeat protein
MRAAGWTHGLLVLGLGGVLIAGCAAAPLLSQKAVVETQETGTPLSNSTTSTGQADHAAKITPEQEVALVEVRKILKEAQEIAAAIQVPSRLFTDRHHIKALEEVKARLLDEIEQAQFRAGDFHTAETTKHVDLLALAQAAYGKTEDAVQTTSRPRVTSDDALLVLVDMLINVGDVQAALRAVDATLAKGVTRADYAQRFRNQAAALALIAQRQHERADPAAKATLQRALEAAQNVISPEDSFWAVVHVAQAQAALGERIASKESFGRAMKIALARKDLYQKSEGLRVVAKAQAESGDQIASTKTFQQAIQVFDDASPPRIFNLACIGWSQATSGKPMEGTETFREAIRRSEAASTTDKGSVLLEIGKWQLQAGDRQGAADTLQHMLQRAEGLPEGPQKTAAFGTVRALAVRAGNWKMATGLLETISDDWEMSAALRAITETLIRTKDPYGTQDVFKQLSESASMILKNPPPKEQSKVVTMRSSIAIVQTAGGNLSDALKTADTAGGSERIRAYGRIANLLTAKGDLSGAQQTISAMEKEWLSFLETEGVVRKLAKAKAKVGDETGALSWGRKQDSDYAKAHALLGVADGLLDRYGIEDIERIAPATPVRDVCSLRPSEPL